MNETRPAYEMIFGALGQGLPNLLLQLATALALLVLGVLLYMAVTPFRERELVQHGNVAAATAFGGAVVALAIPLGALLATSDRWLDIVIWGIVAVLLQLLTFALASLWLRGLRGMIEAGNVAAAIQVVAAQLAIGLLNAAAMVPT
jgi:putative membrane protein